MTHTTPTANRVEIHTSNNPWEEHLSLSLLGPLRLLWRGRRIPLTGSRVELSLLVYLAAGAGQTFQRSALANMFWPDAKERSARQRLRQAFYSLRQLLQDILNDVPLFVSSRSALGLCQELQPCVDVFQFQALLARPPSQSDQEKAVGLYRGEFLQGFPIHSSPAWETWLKETRDHWQHRTLQELHNLSWDLASSSTHLPKALQYAWRQLEIAPWSEEAHRQTMSLLAQSGQRSAALTQYRACCRNLHDYFDATPSPETQALYEQLLHQEDTHLPDNNEPEERPSLAQSPSFATHSFVGRSQELEQIKELLQKPNCRLLTLQGGGGVGKTSLAQQLYSWADEAFYDGAVYISLAGLAEQSPAQQRLAILRTLASAFHYAWNSEDPNPTPLFRYMEGNEALLIIDNCENLEEGSYVFSELLKHVSTIMCVLTSRQPLHLDEEWVLDIQGLRYPEHVNVSDFPSWDAVQLFTQAAQQAQASFQLTPTDYPAVLDICRSVDGLPLALQLLGRWVRNLTCEEIAQSLSQGLDLLESSDTQLPTRHRSLRAIFEASWELLLREEQATFSQLSYFQGGFSRRDTEATLGPVYPALLSLQSRGMLHREGAGSFSIHGTLRHWGLTKLTAEPALHSQLKQRHSQHFLSVLTQHSLGWQTPEQSQAVHQLHDSWHNIQLAWEEAVATSATTLLSESLETLTRFCLQSSFFLEGSELLEQASQPLEQAKEPASTALLHRLWLYHSILLLPLGQFERASALLKETIPAHVSPAEQALFWCTKGELSTFLFHIDKAREHFQTSMALGRQLNDPLLLGHTLLQLGILEWNNGNYAEAREVLEESLIISRRVGDPWSIATHLNHLGNTWRGLGQLQTAEAYYQRSLTTHRLLKNKKGIAACLNNLAVLERERGAYPEAIATLQQSLKLCEELGALQAQAIVHHNLAEILFWMERYPEATEACQRALSLRDALDLSLGVADELRLQAQIHLAQQEHEEALACLHQSIAAAKAGDSITHILLCVAEWSWHCKDPSTTYAIITFLLQHPEFRPLRNPHTVLLQRMAHLEEALSEQDKDEQNKEIQGWTWIDVLQQLPNEAPTSPPASA
ncbi:MAG: tetratricopeptide repeat protein [Deltaproteobacteria bacterium]|nr:MAG: tetratricopeptide repeat protein [Deltaproteobacteria bacterium]